jgi:hypothetical protein
MGDAGTGSDVGVQVVKVQEACSVVDGTENDHAEEPQCNCRIGLGRDMCPGHVPYVRVSAGMYEPPQTAR